MAAVPTPVDDKENLLREDRRLLGRLLGEVIRDQAGADALERIERIRAQAGSPRRPGSLSHALDEVRHVGFDALMQWFARAHVAPVLTAHPTEVQRQSILECEREIAQLIARPASAERD